MHRVGRPGRMRMFLSYTTAQWILVWALCIKRRGAGRIHLFNFLIYSYSNSSNLGKWWYSLSHLGSNAVSKLKARTSLLPRFSEKRRSSFELWALKEHSKISPHVRLPVYTDMSASVCVHVCMHTCRCAWYMHACAHTCISHEVCMCAIVCWPDSRDLEKSL